MSTDIRIRFDDNFDTIIDELRSLPFFDDNGTIALFCAALGHDRETVLQRKRGTRDVRLNVLLAIPGALELTYILALSEKSEADSDPLSDENLESRIRLFEGYANGGLSVLAELKKDGRSLEIVIPELVHRKISQLKKGK